MAYITIAVHRLFTAVLRQVAADSKDVATMFNVEETEQMNYSREKNMLLQRLRTGGKSVYVVSERLPRQQRFDLYRDVLTGQVDKALTPEEHEVLIRMVSVYLRIAYDPETEQFYTEYRNPISEYADETQRIRAEGFEMLMAILKEDRVAQYPGMERLLIKIAQRAILDKKLLQIEADIRRKRVEEEREEHKRIREKRSKEKKTVPEEQTIEQELDAHIAGLLPLIARRVVSAGDRFGTDVLGEDHVATEVGGWLQNQCPQRLRLIQQHMNITDTEFQHYLAVKYKSFAHTVLRSFQDKPYGVQEAIENLQAKKELAQQEGLVKQIQQGDEVDTKLLFSLSPESHRAIVDAIVAQLRGEQSDYRPLFHLSRILNIRFTRDRFMQEQVKGEDDWAAYKQASLLPAVLAAVLRLPDEKLTAYGERIALEHTLGKAVTVAAVKHVMHTNYMSPGHSLLARQTEAVIHRVREMTSANGYPTAPITEYLLSEQVDAYVSELFEQTASFVGDNLAKDILVKNLQQIVHDKYTTGLKFMYVSVRDAPHGMRALIEQSIVKNEKTLKDISGPESSS